jgi:hypothetical protein
MTRVKRERSEGSRDEIPFLSGSPVQGAHFGDRDEQTKLLVSRMTSGRNVLVISPRRFGKTSLLLTAATRARRTKGARVGMANLFYCTDRREVAEEVTRAVLNGALGWGGATIGRLRELVRALPGITPRVEAGGVSYSLAVSSPGHSFLEEIRRPIELLRDSAESAHPVCLVLDEFQQIAEMEGLAGVFKGICDDIPEVSLVFSGSHRHLMSVLFEGGGAALKNVAEPLGLDVIPEHEMTAFLRSRFEACGKQLTSGAASLIYELMGGIPHFVQLLAGATFDVVEAVADEATVREALVVVLSRQRALLAQGYEDMSPTQRKVVRALAGVPDSEIQGVDFGRRAGLAASSIQAAVKGRRGLEEREVVAFQRGQWRLADPLFERFLLYGLGLDLGESLNPADIR